MDDALRNNGKNDQCKIAGYEVIEQRIFTFNAVNNKNDADQEEENV